MNLRTVCRNCLQAAETLCIKPINLNNSIWAYIFLKRCSLIWFKTILFPDPSREISWPSPVFCHELASDPISQPAINRMMLNHYCSLTCMCCGPSGLSHEGREAHKQHNPLAQHITNLHHQQLRLELSFSYGACRMIVLGCFVPLLWAVWASKTPSCPQNVLSLLLFLIPIVLLLQFRLYMMGRPGT